MSQSCTISLVCFRAWIFDNRCIDTSEEEGYSSMIYTKPLFSWWWAMPAIYPPFKDLFVTGLVLVASCYGPYVTRLFRTQAYDLRFT